MRFFPIFFRQMALNIAVLMDSVRIPLNPATHSAQSGHPPTE
jgi:hypothetical protein